jgi:hypothetical protein
MERNEQLKKLKSAKFNLESILMLRGRTLDPALYETINVIFQNVQEVYSEMKKDNNTNKKFSLAELDEMPTLHEGHCENVKYVDNDIKITLSRMTKADGMPYDNQVTVEKKVNGEWVKETQYQAL